LQQPWSNTNRETLPDDAGANRERDWILRVDISTRYLVHKAAATVLRSQTRLGSFMFEFSCWRDRDGYRTTHAGVRVRQNQRLMARHALVLLSLKADA
jgi:hypothetical protein